ncbi:dihydrofolate reductase [Hoeflea poritis]|uniref:Dihydrofolate reductase n=1 Tax=Hoeflea poritis TaxID=2993659 RepID=A0ABT4VP38_9HYPH|nr:dihydrofolate reductase [Hoeflea poritis]MDA4846446.1 dihydrofolate reductase [Hoeflea poritis]
MNRLVDSSQVTVTLVVAVARNGVIGRDGDMPWRLSTDLKRFKAVTMGKPVVMGRKTYQSIGKALPGRLNVVVTRDPAFRADDAEVFTTLDAAFERARQKAAADGQTEICVIGGGEIYRQALAGAQTIHYTRVDSEPQGDTRFPELDPNVWMLESEEAFPAGDKDTAATNYMVYRRMGA